MSRLETGLLAMDVAAALVLAMQGGLALTPAGQMVLIAGVVILLTSMPTASPGVPASYPLYPSYPLPLPVGSASWQTAPPSQFPNLPMDCGVYQDTIGGYTYFEAVGFVEVRSLGNLVEIRSGEFAEEWMIRYIDCLGIEHRAYNRTFYPASGSPYNKYVAFPGRVPYVKIAGCPCPEAVQNMGCDCDVIRQIIRDELAAYLKCVRDRICGVPGQRIIDLGNVSGDGTKSVPLNAGETVNFIVATVINASMPSNIQLISGTPSQWRLGQIALGGTTALSAPVYYNFEQQVFPAFPNPCRSVYWRLEPNLKVNLKAYVATPPPVV